jgi:hypothetical protein
LKELYNARHSATFAVFEDLVGRGVFTKPHWDQSSFNPPV